MTNSSKAEQEPQTEVHKYLAEKNINELFVSIVEAILINRPDNPVAFISNYLFEKFPEQTQDIVIIKRPPSLLPSDFESSDSSSIESASEQRTVRRRSSDCSSSLTRESVGSFSRRLTLPEVPIRKRRQSVCAEKITEDVALESKVKVIPKTEAEASRIAVIMKNNMFLNHLDLVQTQKIQDAMFMVEKSDGDVIIRQGDKGDNFYCVEDGTVNVFIKPRDGSSSQLVKVCTRGDSFGELALMYNAPRAATCVASGNVRLWALDRVSFNVILMKTTMEKHKNMKKFLLQIPLFSQLTEFELLTIADTLQDESFKDGTIICKEGDPGDKFYVVHEGVASCTKIQSDGMSKEVARLSSGSYFGEIALLTAKPRQATVSAVGDLKCFSIDKRVFDRVMGPLSDILMRAIPPSLV
jgi:cAMP-dependent protein kinase regulator